MEQIFKILILEYLVFFFTFLILIWT